MKFTRLVPNLFYADINEGLKLFVECLEFVITHDERHARMPFCELGKDDLRINLFEDAKSAKEHHPELRIVTSDIQEVYDKIAITHPEFLHPNLKTVTLRPWGAKEFALMDGQMGIRIQQW